MRHGGLFDRLAEIRREVAPPPPRWTFFSGVFTFPWRRDAVLRWAYMSLGFTAILTIGLILKSLAASFAGIASGIAAAFFLMPTIWISFMTFSYSAACGLCVLESTAAGLDRIEAWPEPNWKEWMAHMMYVGWIGSIPLAVSYAISCLAGLWGIPPSRTIPLALFVIYPISLMSALEANSVWVPLTLPILGSLVRLWWAWLMFYLLSGLMAAGIIGLAIYAARTSQDLLFVGLGPLSAAGTSLAARPRSRTSHKPARFLENRNGFEAREVNRWRRVQRLAQIQIERML